MATVYHDDDFNYFYENGRLYVGNGTGVFQNGAFNKGLVKGRVLPNIIGSLVELDVL